MNYNSQFKLRLLPRNEGKIKSFDSCIDFRAWSHDCCLRTRYLKEWMKADVPRSIPYCSLTAITRTMTLKSRKRIPPRCHPDCKAKVIVESIAASCHAMRECMKNNVRFNEYFEEEEFETSQWPCDRCMEALKTIKMLWKFLVRKILNIKVPEKYTSSQASGSARNIVEAWQKEIVNQALYVSSVKQPDDTFLHKQSHSWNDIRLNHRRQERVFNKDCRTEVDKVNGDANKVITASLESKSPKIKRKRVNRSAATKVKTAEVACLCSFRKRTKDANGHKIDVDLLKLQASKQHSVIEKLQRENSSLRDELQSVYKTFTWKAYYNPENNKRSVRLVPIEQEPISEDDVDSETVITMKECTHRNFHHVAMLQILRKTNNPTDAELRSRGINCHKGNAVDLLSKVQSTFGAIVNNEINISSERKKYSKRTTIDASSRRVTSCRSAPSFTTITSSLTDFVSVNETSGVN